MVPRLGGIVNRGAREVDLGVGHRRGMPPLRIGGDTRAVRWCWVLVGLQGIPASATWPGIGLPLAALGPLPTGAARVPGGVLRLVVRGQL